MRAAAAATRPARKRQAVRAPSRAANMAAMTGIASQAVDFRSQATARATPELTARTVLAPVAAGRGTARASDSRMKARTGGSVVITARLRPITGEATATAVASSASWLNPSQA